MTSYKKFLCLSAISAITAGPALAGTMTTAVQTDTHHFSALNGSASVLFDGFDSNLGTLTAIFLTLSEVATLNDTALVSPSGSGSQVVGNPTPLTASASLSVTGPNSLATSVSLTTPGFAGMVADTGSRIVVGSVIAGSANSSASLTSPPTNLASYIGGVNAVTFSLLENGTQGGSVPDTVFTGNDGNADVTVTLQYQYTVADVPEPASMLTIVAGLLGLGVVRLRRRR